MVFDAVLVAFPSWLHDDGGRRRVGGVDDARLRRGLRVGADDDVLLRPCGAEPDPVAVVGLVVDDGVVGRVGAEAVEQDPVGSLHLVGERVEERRRVGRPCEAVGEAVDPVDERLAGGEIDDAQLVLFVAVVVGGDGEELMVRADRHVAKGEVVAVTGRDVLVEQELIDPVGSATGVRLADVDAVLGAFLGA